MELIWSQPGFKCENEPLNLRNPLVRKHLGIESWEELYSETATDKLKTYFSGYRNGKLHVVEPLFFQNRHYRPITRRIVYKVIHGGEDRINWFRDTFNARVVLLLRHPIAVSLSREVYPRLETFVKSHYKRHFTKDQLERAANIIATGSKLEQGVLSWCFQNAVPLRDVSDDWGIVTYEQLVMEPAPAVRHLAHQLELPNTKKILDKLDRASGVLRKSDAETQRILQDETEKRSLLINKWRKKVNEAEEKRAMAILSWFDIDVYRPGDVLPADSFWIS